MLARKTSKLASRVLQTLLYADIAICTCQISSNMTTDALTCAFEYVHVSGENKYVGYDSFYRKLCLFK